MNPVRVCDVLTIRRAGALAVFACTGALALAMLAHPAFGETAAAPRRLALMVPVAASDKAAPKCDASADVLGTSRTIYVDPTEHRLIGTMQYRETLPLREGEVVLTFDDGPLPPYTSRVLDALEAQCVKATFFLVGRMAKAYPASVRDIEARGHTLAAHSLSHPFAFNRLSDARMVSEIDDGIGYISAAIGGAKISPFFRIPGLAKGDRVEAALESRGLMVWSADFPADDWRKISASEVHKRAMQRLQAKGKGVLLLHDIQPATALALPGLLADLKARGFRVVHVAAADATHPKTPTIAAEWRLHGASRVASIWPTPPETFAAGTLALPLPAPEALGLRDDEGQPLAVTLARANASERDVFPAPLAPPALRLDGMDHPVEPDALAAPAIPSLAALQFDTRKDISARLKDRARRHARTKANGEKAAAEKTQGNEVLRTRMRHKRSAPPREHHAEAPPVGRWPFAIPHAAAN